jgi:hypothetical protein
VVRLIESPKPAEAVAEAELAVLVETEEEPVTTRATCESYSCPSTIATTVRPYVPVGVSSEVSTVMVE